MARLARVLSALGVLGATQMHAAAAFSFVFTAPVQCGDLTVTWNGGTAPYQLLITPLFSTPQNITIPDSAYNGTHGSFTTTLHITGKQNEHRFLLTMSDSTGFGSGGTSGLLTAGTNSSSQSCNTTDPGTDFTYDLPNALQQCQPYTWSNYFAATQPITIFGLIPLGKAFVLSPPQGPSFTWQANIASGTNIVFVVTDSRGRQGGSTDFYTVTASNDASCINADSPGSTAQSTAAATSTASSTPSSGTTNNATVIGASIAGGAVFLVALASLIWFFLQRRNQLRRYEEDVSSVQVMTKQRRARSVDLLPEDLSAHSGPSTLYPHPSPRTGDPLQAQLYDANGRSVYEPDPYVLPPPSDPEGYFPHTDNGSGSRASMAGSGRHARALSVATTATGGMNKAQMAASGSVRSAGPQRFILHTDAGEVDDNEVVELPPMYTQVIPRRDAGPSSATGAAHGSHPTDDPLRS